MWSTDLTEGVERKLGEWEREENIRRLWSGDQSLWTGEDEADWLGWLEIPSDTDVEKTLALIPSRISGDLVEDVVLLGMGGSSIGAEAMVRSVDSDVMNPKFYVLDSTNPCQIRSVRDRLRLSQTLFIVSSKSGRTFETYSLMKYFLQLVSSSSGNPDPGSQFLAITDPGSELEQFSLGQRFAHVFHGLPNVGGRFSALSSFGLVPAAAAGVDVFQILERARRMRDRCMAEVPAGENPGALLGITMAMAVEIELDKLTLVSTTRFHELGTWIEQMLAESTGKDGTGLVPVGQENLGDPVVYGNDRLFVYLRNTQPSEFDLDERISSLRAGGQSVIEINLRDGYDVGSEFFRWEFATAVAASILGVNPFNQPDVEATKRETLRLTEGYTTGGTFPEDNSQCVDTLGGLSVFVDESNARALEIDSNDSVSIEDVLALHLDRIGAGDYFAILAYVDMKRETQDVLQFLRHAVRDAKLIATSLQFGPRFLHSTGQSHKGGANNGVFLEITSDSPRDLMIPGQNYSFGQAGTAQALGDLAVLNRLERRVIRVHLAGDVRVEAERLRGLVEDVLAEGSGKGH
tara:strand:- start:6075 stop:7802 length:1728 start_codon:yes stop_codon:yes gene_type:complete